SVSLSNDDVEDALSGIEKENTILSSEGAGDAHHRGSTVDTLMQGPDQLSKQKQAEAEQAKADLLQKNIELENAKKREETYQLDLQKYIDQISELRKRIEQQDIIIKKKSCIPFLCKCEKEQEQRIVELQLQLQELQNANAALQNEVKKEPVNTGPDLEKESLRQEVEKLKKEMEDMKKENKESEDQLEKEFLKTQNQLQTHRSTTQELRKETEQQKVALAELESENAALHKQLDQLRMESVRNAQEKKRSSVELPQSSTELSHNDSKTNVVIERTEEELQLNLSSIELLLYRIAGNDMVDSRMGQEQKIKKVCDMVLALSKEIGDLMDRWLQKKQQKASARLRSDKLLFQARGLIAQFTVCNVCRLGRTTILLVFVQKASETKLWINQLIEYEASNLNAIVHENRSYKKENKDLQKKLLNKETEFRILFEKCTKMEEQIKELLAAENDTTLGNEAEYLEGDLSHGASLHGLYSK
ncbi:hypothetical protein RFI_08604, partial [Reticulomyxa filosa]